MDRVKRLQMVTEVVLEFRTQLKNDMNVDEIGSVILDIVREFQDLQLYELMREAYNQRQSPQMAIDCLNEAISYLYNKIDEYR